MVDAGDRAELDLLRRRAYGLDADIRDDPEALERLIRLEDGARSASIAPDTPAPTLDTSAPAADIGSDVESRGAGSSASGPGRAELVPDGGGLRRSRIWDAPVAMVAAAVAVVTVVAFWQVPHAQPGGAAIHSPNGRAGTSPTPTAAAGPTDPAFVYRDDPDAETLLTIRLDTALFSHPDRPIDPAAPHFPSASALGWATPIGEYFGWQVWIAGGTTWVGAEHCILAQRGSAVRARCLAHGGRDSGSLFVSLAASDIALDVFREPIRQNQRIRFWWLDDSRVAVVLGTFAGD